MKDIICINDKFPPEWVTYFATHNIKTPAEGSIYTVREVVRYLVGEPGLLLHEIRNPATPRISPTTGLQGTGEQAWAISRFTDLEGNQLSTAELSAIYRTTKTVQP